MKFRNFFLASRNWRVFLPPENLGFFSAVRKFRKFTVHTCTSRDISVIPLSLITTGEDHRLGGARQRCKLLLVEPVSKGAGQGHAGPIVVRSYRRITIVYEGVTIIHGIHTICKQIPHGHLSSRRNKVRI